MELKRNLIKKTTANSPVIYKNEVEGVINGFN